MGRLKAVVATSSLELGIDMGAVDLVLAGRGADQRGFRAAARRPGRPPGGRGQPGGDPAEVAGRPGGERGGGRADEDRAIEELRYPRNPLDVLAQHIVSMVAMDDWTVDGAGGAGAPGRSLRQPADQLRWSGCSTCSPASTRQRRVCRAEAPDQLGPGRRAS